MDKAFSLDNQLCFEVYKAANQFTKLYRQVLGSYDITYPQYLVLLALWEQDNLVVKQLSNKVSLGIGTVNPIINKLVDKGWLTKEVAVHDKRAVIVSLTVKAKDMETIITEAILSKIPKCDAFVDVHGDLKPRLHELNDLLKKMNDMEDYNESL